MQFRADYAASVAATGGGDVGFDGWRAAMAQVSLARDRRAVAGDQSSPYRRHRPAVLGFHQTAVGAGLTGRVGAGWVAAVAGMEADSRARRDAVFWSYHADIDMVWAKWETDNAMHSGAAQARLWIGPNTVEIRDFPA
jgi:hypothetical protein